MPVIAFLGNKGGVGKTTLSVNFTAGLAKKRKVKVAFIDADPQGSAYQWHAMSDLEPTFEVFEADDNLAEQTSSLLDENSHIVIDCPPYLQSSQTESVLKIADIALVPILPSPMDLWATVHLETAIETARQENPNLHILLVINQLEVRTTFSRVMREALAELQFPISDTSIRRRAIYRNCALEGKSVFDMGSQGKEAVKELNQLIKEVMAHE